MKKLTAMILTLCMVLGMFSGCASAPAEQNSPTTAPTTAPTAAPSAPQEPVKVHFDNAVISDDDYEAVTSSRKQATPDTPPALMINGVEAVYETGEKRYYFSVDADEVWEELKPSVEGYETVYVTKLKDGQKTEFTMTDTAASVIAYNDTEYMLLSVVFTSLPLMSLETAQLPSQYKYFDHDEPVEIFKDSDGNDIPYDPYAAPPADINKPIGDYETFLEMRLLDPDAVAHGYDNGFTTMARAHIRGRSSRVYPKNSYKLELLKDEDGVLVEKNETLLGMRSDGDWNLNGMYAEPTKVRDKISSDIWLAMNENTEHEGLSVGYRCEYLELIINGHYHGLYLITERIDRKQLGLEDGDLLYFSDGDVTQNQYHKYTRVEDNNDMYVGGCELKWPKERSEPYEEWLPFGEYIKLIRSRSSTLKKEADKMLDIESLVNYQVFVQAVAGCDNIIQNTFYVARKQEDGSYRFSFIPWDLDQTFGMRWGGEEVTPLLVIEDYGSMVWWESHFWAAKALESDNIADFNTLCKERYTELRQTLLSDDELILRINEAEDTIRNSGAWRRNYVRWPEGGYVKSFVPISGFAYDRMNYLDSYYGIYGE